MTIQLPYRFDTSSVWHTILKGAFALNALMVCGVILKLYIGDWATALGLLVAEAIVLGFTRLLIRFQGGSVGTLYRDRVDVEANALLGIPLPGPRGSYSLDRFSSVRIEFRMGPIIVDSQSGGPYELVWLVGQSGTPDVLLARTQNGAGRAVGEEFGALLELPVEEKNASKVIAL